MLRLNSGFLVLLAGLSSSISFADTITETTTVPVETKTTTTVVEKHIVTPVPAPKEMINTPEGSVSCFTVEAGWFNSIWIPQHRVCKYENQANGVAWVEGYWACTKFISSSGECTNWDWKAGHWEKTLVNY